MLNGDVFQKCNMIYTIVNTLTELNEVQSVKFLIDGEEIPGFEEDSIKLTNEFVGKGDGSLFPFST